MSARPVAVLLRVEVADFLTPAADDGARLVAEILGRLGLPATFALTARAADALARRGRSDVLRAVSRHPVAFLTTGHSLHPTVAETLADASDDEAPAAFADQEGPGLRALAARWEVSAYVPPPANWASEALPALRRWGIPVHWSEATHAHVALDGEPYVLGGLLHVDARTLTPDLGRLPGELEAAWAAAEAAWRDARESDDGDLGLLAVALRPHELVTAEPWDRLNFTGGRMPPADEWRTAPERPPEEVALAREALEVYLARWRRLPGVTWWTVDDLRGAFPDPVRNAVFDVGAGIAAARAVADGAVGPLWLAGGPLSPAEVALLLADTVLAVAAERWRERFRLRAPAPSYGPPASGGRGTLPCEDLFAAARALGSAAAFPTGLGGHPTEAVVGALARLLLARLADGAWPDSVPVPLTAELLPRRLVKPRERLSWDWPVFRPDMRPERLLARTREAVWTLKPLRRTPIERRTEPW